METTIETPEVSETVEPNEIPAEEKPKAAKKSKKKTE
jgi:hypothetical protein